MDRRSINHINGIVLIALAMIALLAVLSGYIWPPIPDEGVAAHIFQLSIVAQLLALLPFLSTADWKRALPSLRPLGIQVVIMVLAFAALYQLEHLKISS